MDVLEWAALEHLNILTGKRSPLQDFLEREFSISMADDTGRQEGECVPGWPIRTGTAKP